MFLATINVCDVFLKQEVAVLLTNLAFVKPIDCTVVLPITIVSFIHMKRPSLFQQSFKQLSLLFSDRCLHDKIVHCESSEINAYKKSFYFSGSQYLGDVVHRM